jgi:diguanylate cyclase (GGDEF)-like protein/PAS domain S-box-containing protein
MDRSGGDRKGPWWLPFVATPVALLGFTLFHWLGLLGPAPLWVLLGMVALTALIGGGVELLSKRIPSRRARTQLRLACATLCTTVILYATGWGPVIAIGFVLAVIDGLRTEGSKAWLPGAGWCIAGMALGQASVALGVAPSVLEPHVAHAVAAANAACLAIVLYSLGTTTAVAEAAETEITNEREHFRSLVQHASDVIVVVGRDLAIEYISPAVSQLLGYAPDDCVGRPIGDLVAAASRERVPVFAKRLAEAGGTLTTEMTLEHRSGSPRVVEVTCTLRGDGTIVGNLHDVTEQRALERQLRHQANHDVLTGLMNRAALVEAVEEHAAGSTVPERVSVLFVDLDGFKEVNDALGHEQGDAVLVEAAMRITTAVPKHALTGRLGGDEFLVVLPATTNAEASMIAGSILIALEQPWSLGGRSISASIGVATTGHVAESVEDILRRADEAMYEAKRQGRGRFALARAA